MRHFFKQLQILQEYLVQETLYRSSMIVILHFSIFMSTVFLNFFKYFFNKNYNYLKNKEIKIKKYSKKKLTFKNFKNHISKMMKFSDSCCNVKLIRDRYRYPKCKGTYSHEVLFKDSDTT